MTDDYHQPSLVVVDATPLGLEAIVFKQRPGEDVLHARNLETIIQVIYDVEDGVFVIKIDDISVGKDLFDAGGEVIPLDGAVKVVDHEEAAAEQEFTELFRLLIGQVPVA